MPRTVTMANVIRAGPPNVNAMSGAQVPLAPIVAIATKALASHSECKSHARREEQEGTGFQELVQQP